AGPATVLRIARGRTWTGGAAAGLPCREDAGCPDSTCGGGLFDFSTRLTDGTGPIVLRRGACLGGSRAGLSCSGAGDCPGGQCGGGSAGGRHPRPPAGALTPATRLARARPPASAPGGAPTGSAPAE